MRREVASDEMATVCTLRRLTWAAHLSSAAAARRSVCESKPRSALSRTLARLSIACIHLESAALRAPRRVVLRHARGVLLERGGA